MRYDLPVCEAINYFPTRETFRPVYLTIIELAMWPSGHVAGRESDNRLVKRLMSPSPK